ncbi:hypothetical protein SUGI_0499810 [Cryptomeria japonica]|nr:hypothetical protein SUGI_0499810 [Cryptomeria japonica]
MNFTWQAMLSGWMKLNFDSATRGNLGRSGLGTIIRNDAGEVVRALSGLVGVVTNNVVEISKLEAGLQWCFNNEVVNLIIEGDSQVIVNCVTKSIFQNWQLECWILRINKVFNSLGDYHIKHTYQEGNKASHCLANMGIEINSIREFGREDMMPIGLKEIVSLDKVSIPETGIG